MEGKINGKLKQTKRTFQDKLLNKKLFYFDKLKT